MLPELAIIVRANMNAGPVYIGYLAKSMVLTF